MNSESHVFAVMVGIANYPCTSLWTQHNIVHERCLDGRERLVCTRCKRAVVLGPKYGAGS